MTDDPLNIGEDDDIRIIPGGELANMFLVEVNGEKKPVKNTPKNKLLYDYGLYSFFRDGEQRVVSEENPYISVQSLPRDDEYRLWVDDEDLSVVVPPSKSERLLRGIVDAFDHDDYSKIEGVYSEILENQVRRQVVNGMSVMYPQTEIATVAEGWIIRGLFKVTWDASVHLVGRDLDEGSYVRGGDGVRKTDESHDLLELDAESVPDPVSIRIGDDEYTLTEREMEFIAKVEYLLDFEENIDDEAFLEIIKRQARGEVRYADEET